jgi:alpha,alpha-trehalase
MTYTPVLDYIHAYWPKITVHQPAPHKSTLIGLPRPYLIPTDQAMFQEMYYWDSYFTALGVVDTPYEHLIVDMTENMADLFNRFGLIPNASRYYFLSRSQPPILTAMIDLALNVVKKKNTPDEADAFLKRLYQVAEEEHETVWMGTAQPHFRQVYAGLSRYFEINFLDDLASCESGWDHSTRCDDRWLAHLPADLNAILYLRERDFERVARHFGHHEKAASWAERAAKRQQTIHELLWDEREGFFFDYDFENRERNLRHPSLAGFYPLWAGLATASQAAHIVSQWLPRFEFPGGLVTTLTQQKGKQWAYPNGWAPLQWIVTAGLDRYGFTAEAERLRRKWCDNCAHIFRKTGGMWEKYNVVEIGQGLEEEGLYGSIKGFGWSNGVFVDFTRRLAI